MTTSGCRPGLTQYVRLFRSQPVAPAGMFGTQDVGKLEIERDFTRLGHVKPSHVEFVAARTRGETTRDARPGAPRTTRYLRKVIGLKIVFEYASDHKRQTRSRVVVSPSRF